MGQIILSLDQNLLKVLENTTIKPHSPLKNINQNFVKRKYDLYWVKPYCFFFMNFWPTPISVKQVNNKQ